jgi:hypothetical protein
MIHKYIYNRICSIKKKQKEKISILFTDEISIISFFRILKYRNTLKEVWYFDPINFLVLQIIRIFVYFRLISAKFIQNNFHINQVRNESGRNEYNNLYNDGREICRIIRKTEFERHPLINAMHSEWNISKVLLYFENKVEREINVECLRIGLVRWIVKTQLKCDLNQCVLLIRRNSWFKYLKRYSESNQIHLIGYGYVNTFSTQKLLDRSIRFIKRMRGFLIGLYRKSTSLINMKKPTRNIRDGYFNIDSNSNRKISICYSGGKISQNPAERSELFWLNGTEIYDSDYFIYNYFGNNDNNKNKISELISRGTRVIGVGDDIPNWFTSPLMYRILLHILIKIFISSIKLTFRRVKVSPYYIVNLSSLALDYSYWYDFYFSQKVSINVSMVNSTTVGQVLALDNLNAISVSYQYSISNTRSTTFLSAGENVQFVISKSFEKLLKEIDAPVDCFVRTGYIHDSAFPVVRKSERIIKVKKELNANGAKFILCFFDESSVNHRWDLPGGRDREAEEDYRYLLNWLLEDPHLGVIFKPKKSKTLFKRIAGISDLILEAEHTGRCKFLITNTNIGSIYPAEAALMADVCIGKLRGSTAGFEANLIGVPAVLLDAEGLNDHPFYSWGRNTVVYKDWDHLRPEIERFRMFPKNYSDFGNWTRAVKDLDPFKDGQASLRLGMFVKWANEALKNNIPKQIAIKVASEKFMAIWGSEHISDGVSRIR